MKKIIKCGSLFTAADESVQKNMAVVVEGSVITAVLPADKADTAGAEVLDLSDKFVMPGLIDAHLHTNVSGEPSILHAFVDGSEGAFTITSIKNAQRDLMAGFTSVRDEGGFRYTDVAVRDAIDRGMIVGPRMMVSGEALTGTGGHADSHLAPYVGGFTSLGRVINSADEGRKAARLNLKYGADQIKIMATGGVMSFGDDPKCSELSFEEMKAIIDIARAHGRITSAHAHGSDGIKIAVRAGITSIEHGMLMDDECVELMAQHGTYLVPTIIAAKAIVDNGAGGGMAPWLVEKAQLVLAGHKENLRKCREAGVPIAFGTDAGTCYNYHGAQTVEFGLMVEFGFTPAQALIAATRTNAVMMKWSDRLGTVEAGKLADLAAFDKNPLEDIEVMNSVSFVMKDGVVCKKDGAPCVTLQ